MFKYVVFAALVAVALAAPAPKPAIVSTYSAGVVGAPVAYSAPAVATYAAAPVVAAGYGVHPLGYSAYSSYGVPVAYV